ncbi:MAG: hypothetical protein QG621_411 [Patescibacteria group bacterium]|nr:hypothetical protein [Patescibacteria group bacterium]
MGDFVSMLALQTSGDPNGQTVPSTKAHAPKGKKGPKRMTAAEYEKARTAAIAAKAARSRLWQAAMADPSAVLPGDWDHSR